jgi:hypothetical protein
MTPDGDAAWPGFETWHDRVVRTTDGQADAFAIDEVYDAAEGRPHTRTVDPAHPAGETLAERTEELRAYQTAPTQPVLDDAVFQRARGQPFRADDQGSTGPLRTYPAPTRR